MPNKALFLLLLLTAPLVASANCGFAKTDEGMTIVVGKKGNTCFKSEEFRTAFREQLVASVQEMEVQQANERRKKPVIERTARAERLWSLEERAFQAKSPGARYFGQK